MRKKKVIYRKNTPAVLFLLAVICVSGLCLAAVAKDGGLNVESGSAKLIAGAVSGFQGERTEDLPEVKHEEAASDADLNGLSENRTEETKVITNGYETVVKDEPDLSAVFIGSAIAGVNLKDSSAGEEDKPQVVSSAVRETSTDGQTREETAAPPVEGAVLIYHTHSTESYEPYSEGNYHITGNEGTVRNVGDALAEELKSKGITVYHDKTLHDNPTYTNSYGRSLNTAKSYLGQHGEIKVVIDLHRDAMAEGGKKYSTAAVNGANASSFNVVVGRQNNNYPQLMSFAGKVIAKANELYPGLGGRIIEREYKFNQYLSNNYLLLEIGNNGNTIDEAVLTGKLLADVLEAVMREI